MSLLTHFISIVLLFPSAQSGEKADPLERLQSRISVESVDPAGISKLAGHYKNPSREAIRRIGVFGALSGDDLYLFPDGTFIYCEWSDTEPPTIYDKGRWVFENGFVELRSDPDVTWNPSPRPDRKYIAIRRRAHPKEVLLVGITRDLPNFVEGVKDDPNSTLLIVCKKRESPLTQAKARSLKARLMNESWNPDFFKQSTTERGKQQH
jgi:hypothetical protein